jgi:hypothetical protein
MSLATDASMVAVPDNCPFLVNADELDADGDGLGDACHSETKASRVNTKSA